MYTFETLQLGQVDVNSMVLAVVWHPVTIPNNFFLDRAKKLWGGAVNWRTAMAYDATQAIIAALKQSRTRNGLQKVLSSPSFAVEGATGTVQFLPSGDRALHTKRDRKRIPGIGILVQVKPNPKVPIGYQFTPLQP